MPAVSVIIPVYNVEPYLRECLDSVVNQTFRDLEIICVNDGSTDGSPAILEEYAAKDSRIQIVTKENGGLNSARNAGLDRVTGEYFAILDSDDWLDVTAYEKTYARAKESGADMTQFNYTLVGFPDKTEPKILNSDEICEQDCKIKAIGNNEFVCWCYLWKTDFIKKNQFRFHEDIKSADEIPFTIKAAVLANKIAILPERLQYYRYRSVSIANDRTSRRFLDVPKAYSLLFHDLSDHELTNQSLIFLYKVKWGYLYKLYYDIIDKRFRSEFRKKAVQYVTEDERQFMMANRNAFDEKIFSFFIKRSGSFKLRCKYFKGCLIDNIAKKLIPYSPWLQNAVEIVDNQRKQIEDLQNQLEKKNGRNDDIAD